MFGACFLLALLAAGSVAAQGVPQLVGCQNYGALNFELGVRNDDPDGTDLGVRVVDVATGALVDARAVAESGEPLLSTGCGWAAHVGEPPFGTNRVGLLRDTLYRIEIWNGWNASTNTGSLRLGAYEYMLRFETEQAKTSFFSSWSEGYPDVMFLVGCNGCATSGGGTGVRVYPVRLGAGDTGRDVDDFFSDSNWILPYDLPAICASTGCDPEDDYDYPFLTPSRTDASGYPREYATTAGAAWTVHAGRSYSWSGTEVSDLRFGAGGRLNIDGALDVDAMTLTAASPTTGWHGVRFTAGSGGTWSGNTTVERVLGVCPPSTCLTSGVDAAITVENASPVFDGVIVQDPVTGTYLHGLRVVGTVNGARHPAPVATDLTIQDMTGSGAYVHGNGLFELRGEPVVLTGNDEAAVRAAGTGTRAFLVSALNAAGLLRGPQIVLGDGGGVWTSAAGRVTFSSPSGGYGYANVDANDGRGLQASGGSRIDAGTFFSQSYNRVLNNAPSSSTGNGRASGTGTAVYARCNWWGSTTPAAFRVGATSGGTFDAATWLTGDPYLTNPSCVDDNGSVEGRAAGGSLATARGVSGASSSLDGDGDTPADRLSAALDLAPEIALAAVTALVADVPAAPEAASALAVAGGLAAQEGTPPAVKSAARALLVSYAGGTNAALSHAAHAALVGADVADGDAAGALAHAATLVAMGGQAQREGLAAEVFVRAGDGDGDAGDDTAGALAALSTLETAWPGSDETEAARTHLAALGVTEPEARAAAPGRLDAEASSAEGRTDAQKTGAGVVSLVASPNPSSAGAAGAAVTLTLAEAATVRVVLVDLVGREVAVVLAGALAAGTHTATVPVRLAPGVYALRATSSGAVVATARLTVVR